MKIAICANHSLPQIGGSEKIIQQISESLIQFNNECHVYSGTAEERNINGVHYHKLPNQFGSLVKDLSAKEIKHVLIYSDYFYFFSNIIQSVENLPFKVSVVLVGMNFLLSKSIAFRQFKLKKNYFNVITHSNNYQDYRTCVNSEIPVEVIPNGVKLEEFDDVSYINVRDKYGVKRSNLILNVSNFFPGKGQEFVPKILSLVKKEIEDFEMIFVCSSIKYDIARVNEIRLKNLMTDAKIPFKVLKDIPRNDTILLFKSSNVFLFPSQKEVAPLVLIESMAAKLPWVSMNVGNSLELKGGIICENGGRSSDNNLLYNDNVFRSFSSSIINIIKDSNLKEKLIKEGRKQVEEDYNWKTIANKYNQIFNR